MASFSIPEDTLPNQGKVAVPDLTGPDAHAVLAALALKGVDGIPAAETWALVRHHAENDQLETACRAHLETLGLAQQIHDGEITRNRETLAGCHPTKSFITNDLVAKPMSRDTAMRGFVSWVVIPLLLFVEAKWLGQVILSSGQLGLLPGRLIDEVFAYGFAALAMALAFAILTSTALSSSRTRHAEAASRVARAYRLIVAWIFLVASVFGSFVLTENPLIADPFAEVAGWGQATAQFITEIQSVVQSFSGLLVIGLIGISLMAASTIVAAILIGAREGAALSRIEHVRQDEVAAYAMEQIEQRLAERSKTDSEAIARLQGILARIAAGRADFVREVVTRVEFIQQFGETERRRAIQTWRIDGQVIDAGPLFRNR